MRVESYKQLIVWQKSIALTKEVYKLTGLFPKVEVYNLTSQMRRAAVSVPSNIAEGYKRQGLGEFIQFLCVADASAAELETQLILTRDLYPHLNLSAAEGILVEVQKMLITMIKKLNAKR